MKEITLFETFEKTITIESENIVLSGLFDCKNIRIYKKNSHYLILSSSEHFYNLEVRDSYGGKVKNIKIPNKYTHNMKSESVAEMLFDVSCWHFDEVCV